MNFDQESRCSYKACPIQIFTWVLIMKSAYLFWTWKPPMWPTSFYNVQKLSSQDQDLRFIHLVWIPSKLFSRLYQGFLSKYKWALTSVSWTWNYTGSLIQPTILVRCLPVSNLPFSFGAYQSLTYHSRSVPTIPIYHSQPLVSPKILNRHSRLHNYHSSSLHYK